MILTLSQIALMFTCLMQIIILFVLFGFQFYKIVKNRSVVGISKVFIIIGNVQYMFLFCNGIVYYTPQFILCPTVATVLCFNNTLGFYQLLSGYMCNIFFSILYLIYNKHFVHSDDESINEQQDINQNGNQSRRGSVAIDYNKEMRVRRRSVELALALKSPLQPLSPVMNKYVNVEVRGIYPLYFILLILINVFFVTLTLIYDSSSNWTGYLSTKLYADILGYISSSMVLVQYIPQYYTLYKVKDAKNISVITYLMLSIGNSVTFIYLLYLGVVNFTTWLPYLTECVVQFLFVLQILYYDRLYPRIHPKRESLKHGTSIAVIQLNNSGMD